VLLPIHHSCFTLAKLAHATAVPAAQISLHRV
jgi:hypothetical protein